MWKSDKRLYRTKQGKIVEEGDVRVTNGAVLIAIPGDELPTKPVIEPIHRDTNEAKAKKPDEDKAIKAGENKEKKQAVPDGQLEIDADAGESAG